MLAPWQVCGPLSCGPSQEKKNTKELCRGIGVKAEEFLREVGWRVRPRRSAALEMFHRRVSIVMVEKPPS